MNTPAIDLDTIVLIDGKIQVKVLISMEKTMEANRPPGSRFADLMYMRQADPRVKKIEKPPRQNQALTKLYSDCCPFFKRIFRVVELLFIQLVSVCLLELAKMVRRQQKQVEGKNLSLLKVFVQFKSEASEVVSNEWTNKQIKGNRERERHTNILEFIRSNVPKR